MTDGVVALTAAEHTEAVVRTANNRPVKKRNTM
jgi:hypothetical protein